MKRIVLLGALVFVLAGCGEKKLDGSSEEAFKKSIADATSALPEGQRDQFKQDLTLISMSRIDLGGMMSGKQSPQSVIDSTRQELDGKTVVQVMERATAIRLELEVREKQQALAEIQELIGKKAKAEEAKKELQAFTVSKSRFYLMDEKYSSYKKPVIELSVKNGTTQPISRAYFKATIASPGRAIPWFTETFNYEIPGGLEPNEAADWTLAPNQFGKWGKVDAPADAVFTVEVYRLDGADQKALYDAEGLTEAAVKRLEALQAKYSAG
ncbi:putative lipoprotein [Pseudomonas chlororaphis subsp. piscium]|uniref:DUF6694 family lipoprotein n=1 Tax=Pseudomonas chlororaphis TaxID=587753 RepID=UPI000F58E9CA|nr:DUF6694 family lipoprotein [Pseudomonas chlororaphis]AZC51764.1 putative lipoprotein [Pseudomonas chlororaphis subsp. piscium]